MTDEVTILGRVNGWLVSAVLAAINLLLITLGKQHMTAINGLKARVSEMENNKADANDLEHHEHLTRATHDAIFRKIEGLDSKIDASRIEIKGDIKMVADLIRGRGNGE